MEAGQRARLLVSNAANVPAVGRPCPVCGSREAHPLLAKGELRLVRCRQCSAIYADPVPPQFASGQYYDEAGAAYYLSPAKLQSDYAPVRFQRELELFRRHCLRGAVLDVGCCSGGFLFQLQRRFPGCYEVLGSDVSGAPLDHAEAQGIAVLRGNFLELDLAGRRFDAVTFWAVLEHLLEPAAFLDRTWSILRPGGLCFALVPNAQSLAMRLLGARYRYLYPQHLTYFTKTTLAKLVQKRFVCVEARTTHFNPVVLWQDWRSGGREVSNEERGRLLQRTTAYKQTPWLKPAKALYGITERLLGAMGLADNLALVLRRRD
ncbi:Methyltransferase type 11 [Verrucomicrobia bacterium]|nr:Methyltransferase type 11 [Verrucomicrobiota bacterium]